MAAVLVGALVPSAAPAAAQPTAAKLDTADKLSKLERQATKLNKRYRGEVRHLSDAIRQAKRASKQADHWEGRLAEERKKVAHMAASSYKGSGVSPEIMLALDENPDEVLGQAAVVEHMSRSSHLRIQKLRSVTSREHKARTNAKARVGEVRREIDNLKKERKRVRRLMQKFQPESPTTGDSVTPRMRKVRDAVDRRFGPFSTIGCRRGGGGGEHPLGRACDFMLSSGTMPSASKQQLGDDVSDWLIDNANSLGVMYIIYKQRIWDTRSGGGWRQMSDRGSVTQNHYDHVHVSVL